MSELNHTLQHIGALQLVLALLFLGAYAMLLGGFIDGRAQAWLLGVATVSVLGFVALTDPWVHGILLAAFVIVGMGVFIAATWLVTALARRGTGVDANSELMVGYPTEMLLEDQPEDQPLPGVPSRFDPASALPVPQPMHRLPPHTTSEAA
jgi:hypothetical protein